MTTKARVRETARRLFNSQGYKKVTLRQIAHEAGTTIGNLTYHFPRKEDLLLDIQQELYTDFLHLSVDGRSGEEVIEVLTESLRQIQANRTENEFFYTNIVDFSHDSPSIAGRVADFRRRIYQFYVRLFLSLKASGLARADVADQQYRNLAYVVVAMAYTWMQNTTIYHDREVPRIELCDAIRDLVLPYLTPEGQTELLTRLTTKVAGRPTVLDLGPV